MNEFRGFLHWQWHQIRSARWTSWAYLLGLIAVAIGITVDPSVTYFGMQLDLLLMTVGGTACLIYFVSSIIAMQLAHYRYERDRVVRELGRKEQ